MRMGIEFESEPRCGRGMGLEKIVVCIVEGEMGIVPSEVIGRDGMGVSMRNVEEN